MRIAFLLHNAYAIGGTTSTTFNLAASLAERHDVSLVSVFRHRARPLLEPPPGMPLTALVDRRRSAPDMADPRAVQPGIYFPAGESRAGQYHRLAEQRIIDWLAATDADAVISARTGLNVLLARFGPRDALRIGQEHLTHDTHPHRLRRQLQRWYPRLDALVTMTRADARAHRTGLRLPHDMITAIPNSVPSAPAAAADHTAKVIVAAGRLTRVKRYDMLIEAFARISAQRPDWTLRIYGGGPEKDRLAADVERRGLGDRVRLMGAVTPLDPEWAKGSIAAITSAQESFGMTITEAMRCGLPVVSTDCPHGPREIIRDGVDGLLVPRVNVRAYSAALLRLMDDQQLRARMGAVARERVAQAFAPQDAARCYDGLLTASLARRNALPPGATGSREGNPLLGTVALHRATGTLLARGAVRRLRRGALTARMP
ncbi:glycosyltransferase family 4 protein [Streptomyces sp. ISL-11]|uniref:glycosyltransferase family 4 protein n=1 Tax=Streptomyces sp. ISL-11 TaxID=2819174 RepID=UPI001BEC13FC|nr:glycosyltransferase family 4 protein [Streptomyces sp. ISL-11]MBT2384928.1 glycosyltransferase family 4 protein [Streptomyces sp. ISL-11]